MRINSYIPYFDFYVQFTDKGVLFDLQAPDRDIDLEISSTLLDLIKIFIFGNRRSIKTMRIGGDAELKEQFKDLLLYFSLPKLFADWKQWLRQPHEPHQAIASKNVLRRYLKKLILNALKLTVYMWSLNNIKTVSVAFNNVNVLSISVLA